MVPFRRKVGENDSSAKRAMARSAVTFDRAYSVLGSSGESSLTNAASDAPYMMQDDERMKRRTPANFAHSANLIDPSRLMSRVQAVLRLPIGSLLRAAK